LFEDLNTEEARAANKVRMAPGGKQAFNESTSEAAEQETRAVAYGRKQAFNARTYEAAGQRFGYEEQSRETRGDCNACLLYLRDLAVFLCT
jgi:hypothetical protein